MSPPGDGLGSASTQHSVDAEISKPQMGLAHLKIFFDRGSLARADGWLTELKLLGFA